MKDDDDELLFCNTILRRREMLSDSQFLRAKGSTWDTLKGVMASNRSGETEDTFICKSFIKSRPNGSILQLLIPLDSEEEGDAIRLPIPKGKRFH
nr:hypothetical protein [Tanacetum cinerariifolium]